MGVEEAAPDAARALTAVVAAAAAAVAANRDVAAWGVVGASASQGAMLARHLLRHSGGAVAANKSLFSLIAFLLGLAWWHTRSSQAASRAADARADAERARAQLRQDAEVLVTAVGRFYAAWDAAVWSAHPSTDTDALEEDEEGPRGAAARARQQLANALLPVYRMTFQQRSRLYRNSGNLLALLDAAATAMRPLARTGASGTVRRCAGTQRADSRLVEGADTAPRTQALVQSAAHAMEQVAWARTSHPACCAATTDPGAAVGRAGDRGRWPPRTMWPRSCERP
jgi:hypothetical protein